MSRDGGGQGYANPLNHTDDDPVWREIVKLAAEPVEPSPPFIAEGTELRFKASGRRATIVGQEVRRYVKVRFDDGDEAEVLKNDLLKDAEGLE